MKKFILLALLFSSTSFAADLQNCTVKVDGKTVKEITAFDISNFETDQPEATIDGTLVGFEKTGLHTKMTFSNECDNNYELQFSQASIANAVAGNYKKLIGKAVIAIAEYDLEVTGVVTCEVK